MHVTDPAKPQWAIEMQDGTVVTSPTPLQRGQLVNGATVIVDVITLPSPWSAFGVIVVEIVGFQIKG
jgi:hypothetical protein